MNVHGHEVRGVEVDGRTRCAHYATDRDVVAIRLACCDAFYPCFRCHEAVADHSAERLPADRFDEPAVLCGACGETLAASTYLDLDAAEPACPACDAGFNPGCADHHDRYFEV